MIFAGFFASVFLGLIYLYIKTRDTWNWKKIVLWFIGSIVGLVAIIFAVIYGNTFRAVVPTVATVITSYDDISLGDKFSDVEFRKGKFKKEDSSKLATDYLYSLDNKTAIFVDKNSQKVTGVLIGCQYYWTASLNGVGCGDSGDSIQSKFKGEVKVLCSPPDSITAKEDPVRAYDVPKYGVRYLLQKNQVVGMDIFPLEFWTNNQTKWVTCK